MAQFRHKELAIDESVGSDYHHAYACGGPISILVGLYRRISQLDGTTSKIVPLIDGVVTDTRMDTQYVITEYGAVDLLGKTTMERALALIEIAHPDFRQDLLDQAKEMGLVA